MTALFTIWIQAVNKFLWGFNVAFDFTNWRAFGIGNVFGDFPVFYRPRYSFDLGSTDTAEEFDPFAIEEEADENNAAESETAPKKEEAA